MVSQAFLNINNLVILDLARRNIAGGVDAKSEIGAGKRIRASTLQAIYENAKKDGYTGSESAGLVSAAQLRRLAQKIMQRAAENLQG